MSLRINNNVAALNAYRNLSASGAAMGKSLEKLSSGYRINRAADDAAGLVKSEKLRSEITGNKGAVKNAQDGVSFVQTAEGALSEIHSILQRIRELAVDAANTATTDGVAQQAEETDIDRQTDQRLVHAHTEGEAGVAGCDGEIRVVDLVRHVDCEAEGQR